MVLPRSLVVAGLLTGSLAGSGRPAVAPATRWVLAYAGSHKGGLGTSYSVDDFVRLIAAVDSTGRPVAWLSTGMVFLQLYAPSGRTFTTWIGGTPATGADWQEYADSLMKPSGALARLDSAVRLVETAAGPLSGAFPVALMVPYPEPRVDSLSLGGTVFDFHASAGRVAAAAAYVRAGKAEFASARYRRLRLDGFYWLSESVLPADTATVTGVAKVIHSERLRFLWIPYYHGAGMESWRQLGFDEAWLQPNFFFNLQVPPPRLDSAATRAIELGLGIEVEFNSKIYSLPAYFDRLSPYLDMLEAHPALRSHSIALYEGQGALINLSRSSDSRDRALYARLIRALSPSDSSTLQ
jgi:Domain of unknown function (DUF4855)